jgi:hypothetical protein
MADATRDDDRRHPLVNHRALPDAGHWRLRTEIVAHLDDDVKLGKAYRIGPDSVLAYTTKLNAQFVCVNARAHRETPDSLVSLWLIH